MRSPRTSPPHWSLPMVLTLFLVAACVRPGPSTVDADARARSAGQSAVAGSLRSTGAWSLAPALRAWGSAYQERHRAFSLEVTSMRNVDGLAALASGAADLAPLTRRPTQEEIEPFRRATGHAPLILEIAHEATVIVVHADNPVDAVTLAQLDAAFSTTRGHGADPILIWSDLGIDGALGDRPIRLVGPHVNAAGHRLFRDLVLRNGEFRRDVDEQPGPSAVMNAASAYRDALAYTSRALPTRRSRFVPVSTDGGAAVAYSIESVTEGRYPLSRTLFVAIRRPPGQPVEPLLAGFLRFTLSDEGQLLAAERGTVPLSPTARLAQRALLD